MTWKPGIFPLLMGAELGRICATEGESGAKTWNGHRLEGLAPVFCTAIQKVPAMPRSEAGSVAEMEVPLLTIWLMPALEQLPVAEVHHSTMELLLIKPVPAMLIDRGFRLTVVEEGVMPVIEGAGGTETF